MSVKHNCLCDKIQWFAAMERVPAGFLTTKVPLPAVFVPRVEIEPDPLSSLEVFSQGLNSCRVNSAEPCC